MSSTLTLEKRCPRCEERKPLSAFAKHERNKDKLQNYCRICSSEIVRERAKTLTVTHKRCPTCKTTKEAKEFSIGTYRRDGLYSRCRECTRWHELKKRYGVTKENYEKQFLLQDGKCAICKQPKIETLRVDHNHATNQVRGLLCHSCNSLLGHGMENIDVLLAAVEYLKFWNCKENESSQPTTI